MDKRGYINYIHTATDKAPESADMLTSTLIKKDYSNLILI